jgi:hypothetical protein
MPRYLDSAPPFLAPTPIAASHPSRCSRLRGAARPTSSTSGAQRCDGIILVCVRVRAGAQAPGPRGREIRSDFLVLGCTSASPRTFMQHLSAPSGSRAALLVSQSPCRHLQEDRLPQVAGLSSPSPWYPHLTSSGCVSSKPEGDAPRGITHALLRSSELASSELALF